MSEQRSAGWGVPALLFVLGLATRVPFQSHMLQHWDAVNFALALERFDIIAHQPHPPGTMVLFLGAAKLLNWLGLDANSALVWVATLGSAATAPLIFRLAAQWFDRPVAWSAALLALASPYLWQLGEVALTYAPEAPLVAGLMMLCGAARQGQRSSLWGSAFLLALSGGLRPNTPVFLAPLWILAALSGRFRLGDWLGAVAAASLGAAAWLVPLLYLSGGPSTYAEAIMDWTRTHATDVWEFQAMPLHVVRLAAYTITVLGAALVPLAWRLWTSRRQLLDRLRRDWRIAMLVVASVPGLLYLGIVHVRQPGHMMSSVPALILAAALAVRAADRRLQRARGFTWPLVTIVSVGLNASFFLFGPANVLGGHRSLSRLPTRAAIAAYDAELQQQVSFVRRYPVAETAVLVRGRSYRHPDFYLRDYFNTSRTPGARPITLPPHIHRLVAIEASDELPSGMQREDHTLPNGSTAAVLTWQSGRVRVTADAVEYTPSEGHQ